ncbi:MAG: hypothetical protein ACRELG_30065, partial [Gemmataceae bacterium]
MRFPLCRTVLAIMVLASTATFASGQFAPTLPAGPTPGPLVIPDLPPPAIVPVRPLTIDEFAASFKPLPGRYEVLLIHPKTCCPV